MYSLRVVFTLKLKRSTIQPLIWKNFGTRHFVPCPTPSQPHPDPRARNLGRLHNTQRNGSTMSGDVMANGDSSNYRVLSIQSHVVSGYVGNKCAVFPLQVLGFDVDFINSVQFSNHTGYGRYLGQVLQENDLEDLYTGLEINDLVNYTHLLTGYVASESFLRKISQVVKKVQQKCPGTIYLCDPVLGDNGQFYVPESLIPIYQAEVLPLAHIITPNTFELQLLSGMKIDTEVDALAAMDVIHGMGVPIVVLTSLDAGTSQLTTYASHRLSKSERSVWKLDGVRVSGVTFTGAGDLFSALFLAWYAKTDCIPETLDLVTATMESVLTRTLAKGKIGGQCKKMELELIASLDDIRNPRSKVNPSRHAVKLDITT